jgi:hypothetical protein
MEKYFDSFYGHIVDLNPTTRKPICVSESSHSRWEPKPKTDKIVSFRVTKGKRSNWIPGKKGRFIDKNGKRVNYRVMYYQGIDGVGSLMLPESYFNNRA